MRRPIVLIYSEGKLAWYNHEVLRKSPELVGNVDVFSAHRLRELQKLACILSPDLIVVDVAPFEKNIDLLISFMGKDYIGSLNKKTAIVALCNGRPLAKEVTEVCRFDAVVPGSIDLGSVVYRLLKRRGAIRAKVEPEAV